jgi:RNA polymerase sigma factor (sigma-70 family)
MKNIETENNEDQLYIGICKEDPISKEDEKDATTEELFNANQRYALKIAKTFMDKYPLLVRHQKQSLITEALLGLWKAAQLYDSTKSKIFVSYAHTYILWNIGSYIRTLKKNNDIGNNNISLEHDFLHPRDTIDDSFYNKDYVQRLIRESGLNKRQINILTKLNGINGIRKTLKELSIEYNLTKQRVQQIYKASIEKIRKTNKRLSR